MINEQTGLIKLICLRLAMMHDSQWLHSLGRGLFNFLLQFFVLTRLFGMITEWNETKIIF